MTTAPEFERFGSIKALSKMEMSITQKIHGSNAQVYIFEKEDGSMDLVCGSRTRWIYPQQDNYGFANFVHQNKEAFIRLLGPGRHYGEWAGPGINSGEGLSQKTFCLFAWWRWEGQELPPQTTTVPVLYRGPISLEEVDRVMQELKESGSKLVPGYMHPEGAVVQFGGVRYKKVFKAEETALERPKTSNKGKNPKMRVDYTFLCQPIRLEKLLSRDETYSMLYPESLPSIVRDYVEDLVKEDQIPGTPDEIKTTRKAATGQIFKFIKTVMDERDAPAV